MKRGPDLAFEQEGDGVEAVVTEGGKGGESELSEHACGDVAGGSRAVTLGSSRSRARRIQPTPRPSPSNSRRCSAGSHCRVMGIDPSIPALASAPRACPSIQV